MVGTDGFPVGTAAVFCQLLGVVHHHAAAQQNIGLRLHVAAVGIAEVDAGVFHHFGDNFAFDVLAVFNGGVKPGVETAVTVHGGVAHVLPQQAHQLIALKDGGKLFVEDVGHLVDVPEVETGGGCQGRGLHGDVVGGDGGHLEEHHALEEIEDGSGQAVGFDALPLFADEKVFVFGHGVVETQLGVELKPAFVAAGHMGNGGQFAHTAPPPFSKGS